MLCTAIVCKLLICEHYFVIISIPFKLQLTSHLMPYTQHNTFSIIFAHKAIAHLVSSIRSLAIPTGIGDTLGNKGGIGIALSIAETTFCFVNAHLSAHQHATIRRTREFHKISTLLSTRLFHAVQLHESETTSVSNDESCEAASLHSDDCIDFEAEVLDDGVIVPPPEALYPHSKCDDDERVDAGPTTNPLITAFNNVFWFGDLNFRINGTREVVDGMLENHMHDALLCNDQLTMLLRFNRVYSGFAEGPLNFLPTYKFDIESDHYDSSTKRRVPSWTDRILYKRDLNTEVLAYCSASEIKTSDHRPVYATFRSRLSFGEGSKEYVTPEWEVRRESKSEVCCIA